MAEADPVFPRISEPKGIPSAIPRTTFRTRMAMMAVPLLVVAAGGYLWFTSGETASTDNAYVKQDIVSVSSDISGRIVSVNVEENQTVKAGDILFTVDPAPHRVALDQANAEIARAQVEVANLGTSYAATAVDIDGAREDIRFAEADLDRQQALFEKGFTTRTRLEAAQHQLAQAREALRTAEADAAKAKVALSTGSAVPGVNPDLAAAQAKREQALLALSRTVVRAPVSGRVSQASRLQVGQMMMTGLPALSIVASDKSWIEANFKETDLNKMAPGLPAVVRFDAYPDLEIKGRVESIGAGTGSQFSVLPAQNATGNWVKVTQRVPVRIAFEERPSRPMIAGLSASVSVRFDDKRR